MAEHFDADYLRSTVAEVLAKGCAAVVAAEPADPVSYLSLWLHKYVDNVEIVERFKKEKVVETELAEGKEAVNAVKQERAQFAKTWNEDSLNALRRIKDDPYLLWKSCLDAIALFTGCTSAYVAAVADKLWEPKPDPKPEGEEGEEGEGEPPEEEEEEEPEPEPEPEEEEVEEEAGGEEGAAEGGEEAAEGENPNPEGGEAPPKKKKKEKPPKPINYKKKVLIYTAATPRSQFILNKQLNKKTGPVTFKVLLELLPHLHVPNVLYQEGTHFFGTLPRLGAYFSVPLVLKTIPPEIVAILCVDTLKGDDYGTAKPFTETEREFITAAATILGDVLSDNHVENIKDYKTEELMTELKTKLKQIEDDRKAALKKEKAEKRAAERATRKAAKLKAQQEGGEEGGGEPEPEEEEEPEPEPEEAAEGGEGGAEGEGEEEKEEEKEEEAQEAEEAPPEEEAPEEEEPEEPEEEPPEEEPAEGEPVDEKQKLLKRLQKDIAKAKKKIEKLQAKSAKAKEVLEKKAEVVAKLEEEMAASQSLLRHLQNLLGAVLELINGIKDIERKRIVRWTFPPTHVYRVLKGVLHILGHDRKIADSWVLAREIFKLEFFEELQKYDALEENDLVKWKYGNKCLDELTDDMLKTQPPMGFLGRRWLLSVKKLMTAGVKHKKLTRKTEAAAQAFADVQLKHLVAEMDLKVVVEEDARLTAEEQKVQADIEAERVAKEGADAAAAGGGEEAAEAE